MLYGINLPIQIILEIRHSMASTWKILFNYKNSWKKKKKSTKSHHQKGAKTMNWCFNICIALKSPSFSCEPTLLREKEDELINPTEVKVQHRSSEIYVRPEENGFWNYTARAGGLFPSYCWPGKASILTGTQNMNGYDWAIWLGSVALTGPDELQRSPEPKVFHDSLPNSSFIRQLVWIKLPVHACCTLVVSAKILFRGEIKARVG